MKNRSRSRFRKARSPLREWLNSLSGSNGKATPSTSPVPSVEHGSKPDTSADADSTPQSAPLVNLPTRAVWNSPTPDSHTPLVSGNAEKRREITRYRVWMRDHRCCRRCAKPVKLKADNLFDVMHAHEIQLRSDGGDPFDTRNVISLCYSCHLLGVHKQTSRVSAWFVIVILNTELGADDEHGIAFRPYQTKEQRWQASMKDAG